MFRDPQLVSANRIMLTNIKRLLAHEDRQQGRELIAQDEIASFTQPVVILGDPGLGKSMLTRALGEEPGMRCVRAGTFKRTTKPDSLIGEGERIIVDGLDEIASAAPGSAVDSVLEKLSMMDKPSFILSCREADWMGAVDRIKIEDDYGGAPVLLHLQPFAREDAIVFLSREFPEGRCRNSIGSPCGSRDRGSLRESADGSPARRNCASRWPASRNPRPAFRSCLPGHARGAKSTATTMLRTSRRARKNCCWRLVRSALHNCCATASARTWVRSGRHPTVL